MKSRVRGSAGVQEEIETLRKAVRAHDPAAMAALGARLLIGFPGDPPELLQPAEGCRLLEDAARMGHPDACATLAAALGSGNWGVDRDAARAFEYWKKAALNPLDHLAHYTVAEHYDFGHHVGKDEAEALLWYIKASEADPPCGAVASFRAGRAFEKGVGCAADPEAAFYWYSRAANKDDPEAWYRLGLMYEVGRGVEADPREARLCFERALPGHAPAAGRLADMEWCSARTAGDRERAFALYQDAWQREPFGARGVRVCVLLEAGRGAPCDPDTARAGLTGLAAAGCQSAGFYLEHVFGAASDPHGTRDPEAGTWMEIAAKGVPEALHHLAYLTFFGHGVDEDPQKAIELFSAAAAQGYLPSMYALGERFAWGDGTPDDPLAAFEWYLKAAHGGLAAAQTRVGTILENGGLPGQCPFMGIFSPLPWYELAVHEEDPGALYALGVLYSKGRWVEPDARRAAGLLGQAAAAGHPGARAQLEGLVWPPCAGASPEAGSPD